MMARLLRVLVLALAIAAAQGLRIGVTGAHGFLGNEVCWLACSQVLFSPPVFSTYTRTDNAYLPTHTHAQTMPTYLHTHARTHACARTHTHASKP